MRMPCRSGSSTGGPSAGCKASSSEKLLPSPSSLVTRIWLSISLASRAQMDRPMPAPRTVWLALSIW
ncbi:hypothetical protein D3C72_498730 [compost metagenome]